MREGLPLSLGWKVPGQRPGWGALRWQGIKHVTGFILGPLYLPVAPSFVHTASSSNFAPLSLINDINIITIKKERERKREGPALGQGTLLAMALMREFSVKQKTS